MKYNPQIGFVSLGCPKALVDSERIITQLRAQGYDLVPTYAKADLVIVNTCGFIESAVEESLASIQEALHENGKVIVTGCLGVKADMIRERCPSVLHISGPQSYESVVQAVCLFKNFRRMQSSLHILYYSFDAGKVSQPTYA